MCKSLCGILLHGHAQGRHAIEYSHKANNVHQFHWTLAYVAVKSCTVLLFVTSTVPGCLCNQSLGHSNSNRGRYMK